MLFLVVTGSLVGCGDSGVATDPNAGAPSSPRKSEDAGALPDVAHRRSSGPLDEVDLSSEQRARIDEITAEYGAKFKELGTTDEQSANDRRDQLNQEYTKAMLAEMTRAQQDAYLEAVYWHISDFLATHPEAEFEDVFVWGGAYAKKPKE